MEALQHATPNLASTIFFHASTSLRANKDVAMQAVLRSGDALMFVSDALKSGSEADAEHHVGLSSEDELVESAKADKLRRKSPSTRSSSPYRCCSPQKYAS